MDDEGLGAIIDIQLQMRIFERCLEAEGILWLKGCRGSKETLR
ncbi:MAG: hypothetical protein ACTSWP_09855 [Candidatus Freyarchaeota archaeon]|nr:hypothetical protein [Candidatus Freyrarchaeum guaymaensis]